MGEWQRKGLLRKSRGKVVLRLPEELIRLEALMSPGVGSISLFLCDEGVVDSLLICAGATT
jgi:hypothetical protein